MATAPPEEVDWGGSSSLQRSCSAVLRSMGALGLMREAIALHIESLRNHGEVVPKPQASAR